MTINWKISWVVEWTRWLTWCDGCVVDSLQILQRFVTASVARAMLPCQWWRSNGQSIESSLWRHRGKVDHFPFFYCSSPYFLNWISLYFSSSPEILLLLCLFGGGYMILPFSIFIQCFLSIKFNSSFPIPYKIWPYYVY